MNGARAIIFDFLCGDEFAAHIERAPVRAQQGAGSDPLPASCTVSDSFHTDSQ